MWGSDIYVDIYIYMYIFIYIYIYLFILFLPRQRAAFFKKEIFGSNKGMIQALHVTFWNSSGL